MATSMIRAPNDPVVRRMKAVLADRSASAKSGVEMAPMAICVHPVAQAIIVFSPHYGGLWMPSLASFGSSPISGAGAA
jgi:hypothetical protein